MICDGSVQRGPRMGLPATGTPAGYWRHRRAGESACAECLASISAQGNRWNKAHPESHLRSSRKWTATHPNYKNPNSDPERRREAHRLWYAKNQEREAAKFRVWRETNLDRMAAHERLRRARKAGVLTIPFTPDQLAAKMAYWGNRCWMCSGAFEAVDHVKPIVKDGPHILSNLRPICTACNSSKRSAWPYSEVLQRIEKVAA